MDRSARSWHSIFVNFFIPRSLTLALASLLMACPGAGGGEGGPDSTDSTAEGDDIGEEIGGPLCPDPQQGLLTFDLEGDTLITAAYALPAVDWGLVGAVGSGDFDGDGFTDVVIGPHLVFGPITADSEHVALDVGELEVHSVLVVDLEGDGHDELLLGLVRALDSLPHVRQFAVTAARVVEPRPLPTWYDSATSMRPVLAAGDVTGDGQIDVVVGAGDLILGAQQGQFAVFVGTGDGGFADAVTLVHYSGPNLSNHAVTAIGLFDRDGIDGAEILSSHTIFSYAGTKPADFILETAAVLGTPQFKRSDQDHALRAATFADVTQDGRLDAVYWSSEVHVSPGNDDGGFGPAMPAFATPILAASASVQAEDLDGDGLLDVLVAGDGALAIARGQEGGTLAEPLMGEAPAFAGELQGGAIGDIDDDGADEAFAYGKWCGVAPG